MKSQAGIKLVQPSSHLTSGSSAYAWLKTLLTDLMAGDAHTESPAGRENPAALSRCESGLRGGSYGHLQGERCQKGCLESVFSLLLRTAADFAHGEAAFHKYTLRRTKRQVADDLKNLPDRIITTVDVLLTGDDFKLYNEVKAATKIVQNKYLKAGKQRCVFVRLMLTLGTYLKIKEGRGRHAVMLRLRQVVSHPDQLRHDAVWGPACRGGRWMMVKVRQSR